MVALTTEKFISDNIDLKELHYKLNEKCGNTNLCHMNCHFINQHHMKEDLRNSGIISFWQFLISLNQQSFQIFKNLRKTSLLI